MPNNLKVDLTNLDDIEIYELLLQDRISNFPSGFWANRSVEEAKNVAIKLLKYLIDERLKFNKEDVKRELSKWLLTKHNKVPQSYWTQESNRLSALKYVFEVELKWSLDDIKENLNWELMKQQRLYTLHSYYPNIYHICNALYPGKIKPWELRHSEVSDYFWHDIKNRKKAVRWLVKEKLKLNHTQILNRLKKEHFSQYGLSEWLSNHYNSDTI